jgi:Winged helix-turn-helix DNA-binding
MEREKLLMVRALIDAFLGLPDDLRVEVSRLLAPAAAKPNGHDLHPPAPTPPLRPAKPRHLKSTFAAKTVERKLIEAMRDNPGLSVAALANAIGSGRSATGERLRQLAARGMVEKDPTGRWKLKGEATQPSMQSEAARPTIASPS